MMDVVFRADASLTIGTGHVFRCLALADALRKCDRAVSFVCRQHVGHLCDLIEERGFAVNRLPAPKDGSQSGDTPSHIAWFGVAWQEDAEQTRVAIEALGVKPEWLIVDHYAIDRRWESAIRASVGRIMVIDDLADRHHDCDLLLDQNLVAQMRTRYAEMVPAACGRLLGPEYAMLQPIYAEMHGCIPPREGEVQRILIFFGGADNENLTGRAIDAFLCLNRPDIEVDVVIAAGNPHTETIRQGVVGHRNIHLHSGLPTLATLMALADLAIGAAGATSWERLCLGLPTLVVTLAENQCAVAEELSRRGLIRWLGHHDAVDESTLSQALGRVIQHGLHEKWSLECLAAVDGKGINRVCAALTVTATNPLCVRRARLTDESLLLEWANDPITRRNGFSPELISPETHRRWFRSRLRNVDGCRLYIVETADSAPIGQVRFDRSGKAWEVHYALAPIFRGRGLGRALLDAAIQKLRSDDTCGVLIFGQVKADNEPSRRIFESLGFETQPDVEEGIAVYQRAL